MTDYLNIQPYAPDGFVSDADQQDMYYASALRNISLVGSQYSYDLPFTTNADKGDEVYGGDSFQYIPTEVQVGAAIAMKQMAEAGELPVETSDPGMTQLLQSLYQRTTDFWQQLRQASGTGW